MKKAEKKCRFMVGCNRLGMPMYKCIVHPQIGLYGKYSKKIYLDDKCHSELTKRLQKDNTLEKR